MKTLKLMMKDIIEVDGYGDEVNPEFKVYPMEDLEDFEEYIYERQKQRLEVAEFFNREDEWFVYNMEELVSMSDEELDIFIENNREKIIEIYDYLDENYSMYYHTEVRTGLLEENLVDISELDEDVNIVYQDVNLESIAEILTEVSLSDLERYLGFHGTWEIVKIDDMNYLLEH